MRLFIKKIGYLLILVIIALVVIYHNNLDKIIFKEKVYILFNADNDSNQLLDWSKFDTLFPKSFDPKRVLVNIPEYSKLDKEQGSKYDSIKNNFYQYPRKIIDINEETKTYSIAVIPEITIQFNVRVTRRIEFDELNSYEFIELDSIFQMMPEMKYLLGLKKNLASKYDNIQFNIIEIDEKHKTATLCIVEPIIIENN